MVRITKEYDERLTEFLDTAQQLFFEKGYEKTSVNDIIEKIGVAKGTFYHYFKSKKDLLDKITKEYAEKTLAKVKNLIERTDLNGVEKVNMFYTTIRDFKIENIALMKVFMKVIYKDENLVLRHKMFKQNIKLLTPVFAEIIKQGKEEGLFSPVDHVETAELIFTMGANLNETVVLLLLDAADKPENIEKIERKLKVYCKSIERILGAPEGSLNFFRQEDIERFKIDIKGQENSSKKGQ
jgi:AcrR family transcriptional regulator